MEYLSSVLVERKLRQREKCVRRGMYRFLVLFFFGLSYVDADMAE